MKLCLLGKYPPIEGGVSMHTYWMAYGLAERGHQIDVVTNAAEVESRFRMQLDPDDGHWLEPRFPEGGRVTVWNPEPLSMPRMAHIPLANPFVTKLASVATQVIRHQDCDAVLAYYFEPYAMAAHLASQWTGRPLFVMHAGSDLDRLMRVPDLATAYQEMLKRADAVITGPPLMRRFIAMGVPAERIYETPPFAVRTEVFHPGATALDVDGVVARADPSLFHSSTPGRPFDPTRPTIGLYGKLGITKGSFDLVTALAALKAEGLRFNLLAMTHGWQDENFGAALATGGLQEDTWRLPFLPSWRVPSFIRSCTAVCFLERGFPIAIHRPTVPREVHACGTCLVVSGEIAEKNRHPTPLRHLHDALLVADPRDHGELAGCLRLVVERPDTAREIGGRGHQRAMATEDLESFIGGFEALFRRVLHPSPSSRPVEPGPTLAEVIPRLLPWVPALLGSHVEGLLTRFGESADPHGDDELRTAWRFCGFLQTELGRLSLEDRGLAPSVVAYEEARLWALMDDPAETAMPFGALDCLAGRPVASGDVVTALRPLRSTRLRIERFEHDVAAFLRGERPERTTTLVCFHRSPNRGRTAMRINEATRDLLLRCDGSRPPTQIAEDLASLRDVPAGSAGDQLLPRVVAGLQRLYDAGLVVFVARVPPEGP